MVLTEYFKDYKEILAKHLVPLIWGNIDDLIKYYIILCEFKKDTIISETMAFLQLTDGNNFYSFELDSINRIIEKYSKHHNKIKFIFKTVGQDGRPKFCGCFI